MDKQTTTDNISQIRERHKCDDCGKEDDQVWFETLQREPEFVMAEHGTNFIKCQQCDQWFCDDCSSEHARFETYG